MSATLAHPRGPTPDVVAGWGAAGAVLAGLVGCFATPAKARMWLPDSIDSSTTGHPTMECHARLRAVWRGEFEQSNWLGAGDPDARFDYGVANADRQWLVRSNDVRSWSARPSESLKVERNDVGLREPWNCGAKRFKSVRRRRHRDALKVSGVDASGRCLAGQSSIDSTHSIKPSRKVVRRQTEELDVESLMETLLRRVNLEGVRSN